MKTRLVPGLCLAALVLVVSTSAYLMTSAARSAMARQVITRETTAAVERAAQVAEAVEIGRQRLSAAAALPGAVVAVQRGDVAFLGTALARATVNGAVQRGTITIDGRVVAHSPQDEPPVVVTDGATHLRSIGSNDAGLTYSAPILDGNGHEVARLHEELSLTALVPRLTKPLFGGRDVLSLVATDGTVLISGSQRHPDAIASPKLASLMARASTGGTRYHSDQAGHRIASVAPVPGHPWSVLIDADASAADGPAGSLVAKLLVGFAAIIVLGGAILWVAGVFIAANRRRLQYEHAQSVRDAMIDPLTNAGNRRAFEERLIGLRADGRDVGVVIVDIDGLKRVNDTNGHAMGDVVIKRVADAIHAAVRADDAVFRIGGDEFAVLVVVVGANEVTELAGRIETRIAGEHLDDGRALRASVGAAAGPAASVDDLLHEADVAMYQAKRGTDSPVRSLF